VISIIVGKSKIDTAGSIKDLGIHVQPGLRFTSHINTIVSKARTRANLIHRCFISKDPEALMQAFTTYVCPTLEYTSIIWSPYCAGEFKKIESVQRVFTKQVAGKPYDSHLKLLCIESLETRRLRQGLLYTYKMLYCAVNFLYYDRFKLDNSLPTRGHSYKLL
jgi:hypothetical protein